MNKKIVAMLLPILVFAGAGLGAIVNYLSNTLVIQAQFSSPFEIKFESVSEGSINGNTWQLSTVGGEVLRVVTSDTNHANRALGRYPLIIIKDLNGSPITGKEFEQVLGRWDNNGDGTFDDPAQTTPCPSGTVTYNSGCYWNIASMLYAVKSDGSLIPFSQASQLNSSEVQIFFDNNGDGTAQPYSIGAGATQRQELVITLNSTVNGNYMVKLVDAFSLPYKGE